MRKRVKIGRRGHIEEPEIIVIPMIDVMMFLLFFFMVASLAMVVQAGLPVNLPKASNSQQHSSQNITITIMPTEQARPARFQFRRCRARSWSWDRARRRPHERQQAMSHQRRRVPAAPVDVPTAAVRDLRIGDHANPIQ